MPRHRRRRIGWFVRRSTYRALWRQYADLLEAYRALEGDLQNVLEDHEGLLYGLQEAGPVIEVEAGRQTSWGRENEAQEITELIPVVSPTGLDPDKAQALARRTGLLKQPGGAWGGQERGTTG